MASNTRATAAVQAAQAAQAAQATANIEFEFQRLFLNTLHIKPSLLSNKRIITVMFFIFIL